jgi:hypothetical protein
MALGLDLSASDAKIARARVHLETLQREIPVAVTQRKPYTLRSGGIDPSSGWCTFFLTSNNAPEHGLGVIVGELVHNLRCALDYIIPELVKASDAKLGTNHQFPIYTSPDRYASNVGNAAVANAKGPLGGITPGLKEIFDLQPFHKQPDTEGHRLALVQQFSNADKHRITSDVAPVLRDFSGIFENGVKVLEESLPPKLPEWKPKIEYEIARLRFDKPYPKKLIVETKVGVEIFFGAPPFGHDKGSRIDIDVLKEMWEYVAMIVDRFKKL